MYLRFKVPLIYINLIMVITQAPIKACPPWSNDLPPLPFLLIGNLILNRCRKIHGVVITFISILDNMVKLIFLPTVLKANREESELTPRWVTGMITPRNGFTLI